LTGTSESCVCVRLGKLADAGLTCGPKCDARARWDLTPAGRAAAASGIPVLDQRDHDLLMIVARFPAGLMSLARQTGWCRLTIRRRVDGLVRRGLASEVEGKLVITDEGRKALPDAPQREPWVRPEAVSAALARDVQAL
jgi:hypothetical protein